MNIQSKTATASSLSIRAAQRLNRLLTSLGHPVDTLGRIHSFSLFSKLPQGRANNILSGQVPWTLDDVASMSALFGKPPGYFLDPSDTENIPPDTRLVVSADGGESSVWRAPSGFVSIPTLAPPVRLRSVTAAARGFFRADSVPTLLVFEDKSPTLSQLAPQQGYIVENEAGQLRPLLLQSIHNDRAVFSARFEKDPALLVPVPGDSDDLDTFLAEQSSRIVGRVVGAVQGF